jgi:Spy/CpxP family protein refolding chaperone
LHEALKGSHKQIFEQMKSLREKSKAELLKQNPSKKVLDEYASQFGELNKQFAQKRADHMLKIKAILTPEQFTKLLSREDNGPGGLGGPRGKRWKDGKGPAGQGGEETEDR